jgi:hypothetical protein
MTFIDCLLLSAPLLLVVALGVMYYQNNHRKDEN